MFGQLSRQKQTDGGLDFSAGDGGSLVVVGQTGRLGGDPLKQIIHERVHDGHCLAGDSNVWVHLLQHLVDVDGVVFSLLLLLRFLSPDRWALALVTAFFDPLLAALGGMLSLYVL